MDKWRVIGAEAQTGSEKSIEVNARDEAGAREAARMLGMLVERIERLREPTGPILSYRSPGTPNRPASVPLAQTTPADNINTPAPPYLAILRSASAVTRMARVLWALGLLTVALAGIGIVGTAVAAAQPETRNLTPGLLALVLVAGSCGVIMLSLATALQLMAATALAIRDMAKDNTAEVEPLTADSNPTKP